MATMGELTVGEIIELKVGTKKQNFIVVHQGNPDTSKYDSSCDGTWLMMEKLYYKQTWSITKAEYVDSYHNNYLNNNFFNLLDAKIQEAIKQVKIPYTFYGEGVYIGTLLTGADGLSTKIFLPSYAEISNTLDSTARIDGAVLDYFKNATNSNRILRYNNTVTAWWTRSPITENSGSAWYVTTSGSIDKKSVSYAYGGRPTFILPSDFSLGGAIKGSVNIGGTYKELVGGHVNIGGTWKEICGSYVNIGGTWKQTF